MSIWSGTLLIFGVFKNDLTIPYNCELEIAEKLPVALNYDFQHVESVVGHAEVSRWTDAIYISVELDETKIPDKYFDDGRLYVGGFYYRPRIREKEIIAAQLTGIGIFPKKDIIDTSLYITKTN